MIIFFLYESTTSLEECNLVRAELSLANTRISVKTTKFLTLEPGRHRHPSASHLLRTACRLANCFFCKPVRLGLQIIRRGSLIKYFLSTRCCFERRGNIFVPASLSSTLRRACCTVGKTFVTKKANPAHRPNHLVIKHPFI